MEDMDRALLRGHTASHLLAHMSRDHLRRDTGAAAGVLHRQGRVATPVVVDTDLEDRDHTDNLLDLTNSPRLLAGAVVTGLSIELNIALKTVITAPDAHGFVDDTRVDGL